VKIAAVCVTWNRPRQLGEMLYCFEQQEHPNCELVILDDANQYGCQSGFRWRLISTEHRFPSLGAKRNTAISLVSPDIEAVAVWDDDDLYLPWALSACSAALEQADWCRPSIVLHPRGDGVLQQHFTWDRPDQGDKAFHGGWAYTIDAWHDVGGYDEAANNGEDRLLARAFLDAGVRECDPIAELGFDPYYSFTWTGTVHFSGQPARQYDRNGSKKVKPAELRATKPKACNLESPAYDPQIYPRKFRGAWMP